MTTKRARVIAEVHREFGQRVRLSCRGLMIAASVALQQFGTDNAPTQRDHPPYVQLLDDPPDRFSERELIGGLVLTTDLKVPADDSRMTGNQN